VSGRPAFDPRRAAALLAELERRAVATLAGDGRARAVGQVAGAMLGIAARIGEEVTRRLDSTPAKQEDNFFTAMGLGRDPARPSRVPVAFKLADPAPADIAAPSGTRLAAESDGPPIMFETERGIDLAPGSISALAAVDAAGDSIFLSPGGVAGGELPRPALVRRSVRGGAAAGATRLQISPASGIEAGAVLSLGAGEAAREYRVTAVEGELLTVEPPLESALASGDPAVTVGDFVPFGRTSRNRQLHALYLGHRTLLDVPSKLSITVTGAPLPAETEWSWWGKAGEDSPPAWQPLVPEKAGGRLQLGKEKGKPLQKEIGGKESLWLRAKLPNRSAGSIAARDIRIAITDAGLCQARHEDRCKPPGPASVEFEAVANSTAIVPNSPFHPFGREPRLFDSFYIGCAEAFGKKQAEVSLCIELGGPKLGRLAAIEYGSSLQAFGVGTDGILYRGRFSADGGRLLQVPPARQSGGNLPSQATVAAHLTGETIDVAVACVGEVQLATFSVESRLDPASVQWARLPLLVEDAGKPVDQVAIQTDAAIGVIHARVGTRLLSWSQTGESFQCVLEDSDTAELTELAGTEALLAVGVEIGGQRIISQRYPGYPWTVLATVPAADLPDSGFIASIGFASGYIVLAGYVGPEESPQIRIVRVATGLGTAADLGVVPVDRRLPLAFEPAHRLAAAGLAPDLIVATDPPLRFLWHHGSYQRVADTPPIGPSDNGSRLFVHGGGFVAVQASDLGLLYRQAPPPFDAEIFDLSIMVDAQHVPATASYVTFGGAATGPSPAAGPGYALIPGPSTGAAVARLLIEIVPPGKPPPEPQGKARLYRATATTGDVTLVSTQRIELENIGIMHDVDVAFYRANDSDDPLALPDEGIWRLQYASIAGGTSKWKLNSAMPDPSPGDLRFRLLQQEADGAGTPIEAPIDAKEVAVLADPATFDQWLLSGPLASAYDPTSTVASTSTVAFYRVIVFPHDLVEISAVSGLIARFVGTPASWTWSSIGPNQPTNPALSWEYWNGHSWWALAIGNLRDSTANLLFSGGLFFDVPSDIEETEVAGRKNYWIRARLSGGDYGEAKVSAVSHKDVPVAGDSTQTIERDTSNVRAPYVTSLKVGFCARELVPPEIVLTEDNLGIVNRTGANDSAMEIPVFASVAELMNPAPPLHEVAGPAAAGNSCDEPCPLSPSEIAEPDPCDSPGASDRCDNPCLGGEQPDPASDGAPGESFGRGLLLGFDKAFRADSLALYFDLGRGQLPGRLRADALRNGRFERVEIVKDTTFGLSEPGILILSCPQPPDETELAGSTGHWLRIAPEGGDSGWAPRVRGVYLNAVEALSIETRALESLGHSSGSPDQVFRLSRAPVQASSLVLRVREDVSDEEAAEPGFDVVPAAGEMPGPWVAWRLTEDLSGEGPDSRVFELDQQTGLLNFGNGRNGAIPPLGSEILAVSFAYVQGAGGNKVPAGGTLQLVSPVAGVEKVAALTAGAGGSDVEAPEAARRRAPAKLRHGGRILTLADLEDFATAFSPEVAQARARLCGGAIRLVVAANGRDPSPSPALLRALARAVTEDGAYGLRRAGGLVAVPPVLLPIAVELLLDPDDPDAFPELAAEARAILAALLDPATGGLDGTGWPIGAVPADDLVSAALEPVASRANIAGLEIFRLDREEREPPPPAIGGHVLITLAAADVHVEQALSPAR